MSITSKVEHHDIDESNYISQESCVKEVEHSSLKFDDDILSMEYESCSYGLDINESFDECFCVEYDSFSFDPIITDHPLESRKFKSIKSWTFVPMTSDLDQTLAHVELKILMNFGPTILPRLLIHYDKISKPMSHLLAHFE